MLRRRLVLYTLLYIAGITAGFFMFEKSRALETAGFCTAVIGAVFFTDPGCMGSSFHVRESSDKEISAERHLNRGKEYIKTQKNILAMMFLAGFLLFAFRSLAYSSAMSYVHNKNYVRGKVVSVSVKDEKVRLIVRNKDIGPRKVLVTLDEHAAARSAEKAGSRTARAFVRSGAYGYIGAVIEARGEYSVIPSADDPGCFDYGLYMKSQGVTVRFNAYILEISDKWVSPGTRVSCC